MGCFHNSQRTVQCVEFAKVPLTASIAFCAHAMPTLPENEHRGGKSHDERHDGNDGFEGDFHCEIDRVLRCPCRRSRFGRCIS